MIANIVGECSDTKAEENAGRGTRTVDFVVRVYFFHKEQDTTISFKVFLFM